MPSVVCSQCSRANPPDASYCYFDGVRLAGAASGPIDAAKQNFPMPFTFPSGLVCKNFDQFATACQDNWQAALALLKDGFLTSFFGGMGRSDLAMAAQEAARFPDRDRGLDQLLDKLPTQALPPPKLKVEPTDMNLGQVSIGTDRAFELRLKNTGSRLLYGTIASDSKWLTLGDAPGSAQKLFQFGADAVLPVQLRGQHLRAGNKPSEGQLLIESNGGNITVNVRVQVPITPIKEGMLAGCMTPRQVAEKARANPNGAAPLFEKGAVADWFKCNGWTYPVQGPSAIGLGAVQQFFEALGLAKAPKVQVNQRSISLKGAPGQRLETVLEVSTQEKKPVYAHATCEQPWVDVSKVKLAGRHATITVAVPSVPHRSGETLETKIQVAGNGNQRFTVALSLAISGAPVAGAPPPPPSGNPFADLSSAVAVGGPPAGSSSGIRSGVPMGGAVPVAAHAEPLIAPKPPAKKSALLHLLPFLLLLIGVLVLPVRDWLSAAPAPDIPEGIIPVGVDVDPKPRLVLMFDAEQLKPTGDEPPITKDDYSFGLWSVDTSDPKNTKSKKVLFGPRGETNSTLIRIDDEPDLTFGRPGTGDWLGKKLPVLRNWPRVHPPVQQSGIGTWVTKNVHITQTVIIIPGEPEEVEPDVYKSFYDTCFVKYTIENKDEKPHFVGMRVMLDTLIGQNDGAPFTIPGLSTLITKKEFKDDMTKKIKEVPDFVMALENPDIAKPGTVVQVNLHLHDKLEAPSRVLLTRWPGDLPTTRAKKLEAIEKWEVPVTEIEGDSSIVMYWLPEKLRKDEKRELGYSYGLGSISAGKTGQLAVTVGGNFTVKGKFSVVALVSNARPGERLTLELPKELKLLAETKAEQDVLAPEGNRPRPNTWLVESTIKGAFTVTVKSAGARQLWNTAKGGTFTISTTVNNQSLTTTPIAYNASAADVQASLNKLAGVNVAVIARDGKLPPVQAPGTPGNPWIISGLPSCTISDAGLTGGGSTLNETPGAVVKKRVFIRGTGIF